MKNKTLRDSLVGLFLGMAVMLGAYYLIPKETIHKFFPNSSIGTIIYFSSIIICPFIGIFLHELGHLLAGLVQDFKLQLFVVTFFGIKRENDKVIVYLNKNLQYFGGVAATSPKKITDDLSKQFAIILMAGPLFSLISGILFLAIFIYTDTVFNASFAITGIISIGLFFATTIPEKSGIFFTDRKRMQRLFEKGKVGKIESSLIMTTSQLLIDNDYKNLNIADLKLIQSDDEPIIQFWGYFYEFKHFEALGDAERSTSIKQNLYTYKEIVPKSIWESLSIN